MNKRRKIITCKNCNLDRPLESKGLCRPCYQRQLPKRKIICFNCNQEKPHEAKGLCVQCYYNTEERKAYDAKRNQEPKRKIYYIQRELRTKNINSHRTRRFQTLIKDAGKRKIDLAITEEQYLKIVENNVCCYCGNILPNRGYGLDRKDNLIGYLLDNCVPCCSECNRIKSWILSYEEMIIVAKALKDYRQIEKTSTITTS